MPAGTNRRHASQARSVLARASSARVTWLGPGAAAPHDVPSVAIDRPDAPTPARRRPAVVEVTDVAPLPTRERVRARVRLHGYAEQAAPTPRTDAAGARPVRIAVEAVELESGGRTHLIRPAELREARPDPFARREARFLSHLATTHAEVVAALGELASRGRPVERVVPLALEREGITLRLERAAGHDDVLLAFPAPAETPDDVRRAMLQLAERAAACGRGRDERGQRLLPALFRSGPAAARICRPDA
jgi:hypothetical protein